MNSALRAIGCKLAKAENLSDTDFYAFLEEVDCSRHGAVSPSSGERERAARIRVIAGAAAAGVCSG